MVGISKESVDLVAKRREELKRIIPEAFSEGKLDLNKLKQALGDVVETSGERYSFHWAGKSKSIQLRDKRSKATLTPSRKESVNFDETDNVFIEGENLETLKILQKAYQGKVKMIYIDPPYNTGKDFVYKDDFADPLRNYLVQTGQLNEKGEKTTTNTETSGRYHSNWLSMMYPRLALARNLLSEDGVIFVSIDDNEVHNLRLIMNEIFGEENFLSQLVWNLGTGTTAGHFARSHEYILTFAKEKSILENFSAGDEAEDIRHGALKKISTANPASEIEFPAGIEFEGDSATFRGELGGDEKQIVLSGEMVFEKGKLKHPVKLKAGWAMRNQILSWLSGKETFDSKGQKVKRFYFNKQGILWYEKERETVNPKTVLNGVGSTKQGSIEIKELFGFQAIDFPKPSTLIKTLVKIVTATDGIVVDFFAGSGTTAQAVLEQNAEDGGNRKFILVQLPEPTPENSEARKAGYKTIADICKERIRRVIKKLNAEGKQQKLEGNGRQDLGFKVFKLSKSNCFVWDEEEVKDPNTLARYIEESAKGASKAEPEALLYEIMLREGFALDSKIEKLKHGKNEFYEVSDGAHRLFACFDDKLDDEAAKKLSLEKDDKLVVLDSALTDTQKVNLARKMRIETV